MLPVPSTAHGCTDSMLNISPDERVLVAVVIAVCVSVQLGALQELREHNG